jgi:hypothetical protein
LKGSRSVRMRGFLGVTRAGGIFLLVYGVTRDLFTCTLPGFETGTQGKPTSVPLSLSFHIILFVSLSLLSPRGRTRTERSVRGSVLSGKGWEPGTPLGRSLLADTVLRNKPRPSPLATCPSPAYENAPDSISHWALSFTGFSPRSSPSLRRFGG